MDLFSREKTLGVFHVCLRDQVSTGAWDSSWSLVQKDFCQELPGAEESGVSADCVKSGSARKAKGR